MSDVRPILDEIYDKLAEAEAEIASGDEGEDFFEFAKKLRLDVFGVHVGENERGNDHRRHN